MVFPDNLRSISFQEPNESAKPPLRNAGISDGRPTLGIRNPAFVIAAHCGQIVGRIPFRREPARRRWPERAARVPQLLRRTRQVPERTRRTTGGQPLIPYVGIRHHPACPRHSRMETVRITRAAVSCAGHALSAERDCTWASRQFLLRERAH